MFPAILAAWNRASTSAAGPAPSAGPVGSRSPRAAAATTHEVTVSPAVLARLAPGSPDPGDLVRRSFAFLLAREAKESILGRFDLPLISRYFPEYERTIRQG